MFGFRNIMMVFVLSMFCFCNNSRDLKQVSEDESPNIVLIFMDDMGYGDVSCLNPDSQIRTANLDTLAAEGMTCTDVHACSSVCTPSRYGLLTGRYAWRTPMKQGVLWGTVRR